MKPTKAETAAKALNPILDLQCQVSNSRATCLRYSAEWTSGPSTNMISLRGQKKSMEATPSHTIMARLKAIHQRAAFTRQHRTRAPAPKTHERNPKGGKKSEGPLTDMKSIAISSDSGGSAKTFG